MIASPVVAEADLSCPNPDFAAETADPDFGPNESILWMQGAAYYVAAAVPLFLSVLINVALTNRLEKRPYRREFVNKLMLPINLALASPIMGPAASKFQQLYFSLLNLLNEEPAEKNSGILEARWRDTQTAYSVNAQMSRNVYASLTGRIGTNLNRAKNAIFSGDEKYAADQIAEAAITMRILFAEIRPNDHLVSMTVHLQFTNHVKFNQEFVNQVLAVVAKHDPEFQEGGVKPFYEDLLKDWLN